MTTTEEPTITTAEVKRGFGRLGRPQWNEDQHPRDREGQFIETGGTVRITGGSRGTVVRALAGGNIEIEREDGKRVSVHKGHLTVVENADGSEPRADKPSTAPADAPRFADADAVRKHWRKGGDLDDAGLRQAAKADLTLSRDGNLVLIKTGGTYAIVHAGTGLDLGVESEWGGKDGALRLADALGSVVDANGEPFDWASPGVRERMGTFRSADGGTLADALQVAKGEHDLANGKPTLAAGRARLARERAAQDAPEVTTQAAAPDAPTGSSGDLAPEVDEAETTQAAGRTTGDLGPQMGTFLAGIRDGGPRSGAGSWGSLHSRATSRGHITTGDGGRHVLTPAGEAALARHEAAVGGGESARRDQVRDNEATAREQAGLDERWGLGRNGTGNLFGTTVTRLQPGDVVYTHTDGDVVQLPRVVNGALPRYGKTPRTVEEVIAVPGNRYQRGGFAVRFTDGTTTPEEFTAVDRPFAGGTRVFAVTGQDRARYDEQATTPDVTPDPAPAPEPAPEPVTPEPAPAPAPEPPPAPEPEPEPEPQRFTGSVEKVSASRLNIGDVFLDDGRPLVIEGIDDSGDDYWEFDVRDADGNPETVGMPVDATVLRARPEQRRRPEPEPAPAPRDAAPEPAPADNTPEPAPAPEPAPEPAPAPARARTPRPRRAGTPRTRAPRRQSPRARDRAKPALRSYQRRYIAEYRLDTDHPDRDVRLAAARLRDYQPLNRAEAQALSAALRGIADREQPRRAAALRRTAEQFDLLDGHLDAVSREGVGREQAGRLPRGAHVRLPGLAGLDSLDGVVTGTRTRAGVTEVTVRDAEGRERTRSLMRSTPVDVLPGTIAPPAEPEPERDQAARGRAADLVAGQHAVLDPDSGTPVLIREVEEAHGLITVRYSTPDGRDGIGTFTPDAEVIHLPDLPPRDEPDVDPEPRDLGSATAPISRQDVQVGDRVRIRNATTGQDYSGVVEEGLDDGSATDLTLRLDGGGALDLTITDEDEVLLVDRDGATGPEALAALRERRVADQAEALAAPMRDVQRAIAVAAGRIATMHSNSGKTNAEIADEIDGMLTPGFVSVLDEDAVARLRDQVRGMLDPRDTAGARAAGERSAGAFVDDVSQQTINAVSRAFRDNHRLPTDADEAAATRRIIDLLDAEEGYGSIGDLLPDHREQRVALARASESVRSTLAGAPEPDYTFADPGGRREATAVDAAQEVFNANRAEVLQRLRDELRRRGVDRPADVLTAVREIRGLVTPRQAGYNVIDPTPEQMRDLMRIASMGEDQRRITSQRDLLRQAARRDADSVLADIEGRLIEHTGRFPNARYGSAAQSIIDSTDTSTVVEAHRTTRAAAIRGVAQHLAAGGDALPDDVEADDAPVTEGSLRERVRTLRTRLPEDPAQFGMARRTTRGFAPFTLDDLAAGRTPEVAEVVEFVPDRAGDGGPGHTAMRHLAVVRQIGQAVSEDVERRTREAMEVRYQPETGDEIVTDTLETYRNGLAVLRQTREEKEQTWKDQRAAEHEQEQAFNREHGMNVWGAEHAISVAKEKVRTLRRASTIATYQAQIDRLVPAIAAYQAERTEIGARFDAARSRITDREVPAERAVNAYGAKYRAARRQAVIDAVSDVRDLGASGDSTVPFVAGSEGDGQRAVDALRWAEQHFPTDWLHPEYAGLGAGNGRPLNAGTNSRGYYSRAGEIRLSPGTTRTEIDGAGNLGEVAVHELMHHMEYRVPGLQAAEEAFLVARSTDAGTGVDDRERTGSNANQRFAGGWSPGSRQERGRRDEFAHWYTGREYEGYTGEAPDGPGFEVLTTAVQAVFGGAEEYLDRKDQAGNITSRDDDLEHFLFGALAGLGARSEVPADPEPEPEVEPAGDPADVDWTAGRRGFTSASVSERYLATIEGGPDSPFGNRWSWRVANHNPERSFADVDSGYADSEEEAQRRVRAAVEGWVGAGSLPADTPLPAAPEADGSGEPEPLFKITPGRFTWDDADPGDYVLVNPDGSGRFVYGDGGDQDVDADTIKRTLGNGSFRRMPTPGDTLDPDNIVPGDYTHSTVSSPTDGFLRVAEDGTGRFYYGDQVVAGMTLSADDVRVQAQRMVDGGEPFVLRERATMPGDLPNPLDVRPGRYRNAAGDVIIISADGSGEQITRYGSEYSLSEYDVSNLVSRQEGEEAEEQYRFGGGNGTDPSPDGDVVGVGRVTWRVDSQGVKDGGSNLDGLPEDTKAFLRDAYVVSDEQTGLRTEIGGYSISRGGNLTVSGKVRDRDGNKVGTWTRVFSENPDGGVSVYHAYLSLDANTKGQKIGDKFFRQSIEQYQAEGVREVTVHANIDIGGYAWAQRGYEWERFTEAQTVATAWMRAAANDARKAQRERDGFDVDSTTLDEQIAAMRTRIDEAQALADLPSPKELANWGAEFRRDVRIGVNPDGTPRTVPLWPGKRALLGLDWHGRLTL